MSSSLVPFIDHGREACLQATRGLCHTCGRLCEAKLVARQEKVFLVKWCPEHGRCEALVSSGLAWYQDSLSYIKPGTRPRARAVSSFEGCPSSCGLCPEHQQHTCVPLLEITGRCDLRCPICLVGETEKPHLSPQQVTQLVDQIIRYEGQVNMLTLSGGEPTCHPAFLEILEATRRPEIGIVSISTNGLALAQDDDLIKAIRDREAVISLQLDGFRPATYETLRGRADLATIKHRLVEKIVALGGRLSLTITLARGVNEEELEEILALFLGCDQILSIMIQPLAHTARALIHYPGDPLDLLTVFDVVQLLATASRGVLRETDFTPLPCSHPSCFALTYLLKTEQGQVVPLPRIVDADSYLDIIKNQALLSTDQETLIEVQDALYALWSSNGMIPDRDAVLRSIRQILLDLNRLSPQGSHRQVLDLGAQHVKSIFIHHFMDRYTFDLSRAVKCCNHYPQVDGRLLPACIRNNLPCP